MLSSEDTGLTDRSGTYHLRLAELAEAAVTAIETQLGQGREPRAVVVDVVRALFASGPGTDTTDPTAADRRHSDAEAPSLFADASTIDRIASAVLEILRVDAGPSGH